MLPPQLGAESSDGDPWYHDPDYPDDTVNLRREPNNEIPRSNEYVRYRDWILERSIVEPDENGRWRRYIAAMEDAWAECFDAAEDRAAVIEDLTAENENLSAAAGGEEEADRAAREVLAARREVAELRRRLAEAEESARASEAAVRVMMAAGTRSQVGTRNATNVNTFTIDPRRLPEFKGERDMQVVGDFINDLQRQFEARCYEIGWLQPTTPVGSGTTTLTMATGGAAVPRTDGWTRYALLQLKEAAGRWASSIYPTSQPYPTWGDFCTRLKEEFTPLDALRNFEDEWQLLAIPAKGHVATFNEEFRRLRLQLDPHAPMASQQLLDAYATKLRPNESAYRSFIQYRNFRREMGGVPTLERAMAFVADSDTSAPPKDKAKAAEISAMYGGNNNRNRGNREPLASNECAKCHATDGHWAYDCPNQETSRDNSGGRGRRGGGNRGSGNGGAGRGGRWRNQWEVNAAEGTGSQETGGLEGENSGNA
jgi:hypothetical protein